MKRLAIRRLTLRHLAQVRGAAPAEPRFSECGKSCVTVAATNGSCDPGYCTVGDTNCAICNTQALDCPSMPMVCPP